ncbi:hypothetical protein LXL04_023870 [Taraxacum kok-saghyz]
MEDESGNPTYNLGLHNEEAWFSHSPETFRQPVAMMMMSEGAEEHPSGGYTFFPLLLLLEAAVNCRSSSNDKLKEGEKPLKISDIVAEGALQCLEELLIKCHLGSMEQQKEAERRAKPDEIANRRTK